MADLTDGRYTFEWEGKRAVFDLYMVRDMLYYEYTLNGNLLVKQGSANPGESRQQLLERLKHTVKNSHPRG